MAAKKNKEPFCGDMLNSLEKTNIEFHWSRAYSWYSYLLVEDVLARCLRDSGMVKDGCIPKFFTVPELVLWSTKYFDTARRVIQVGDTTVQPISLNPIVF